jgi:glycosyltransferase involved in cell wall biosynthesis
MVYTPLDGGGDDNGINHDKKNKALKILTIYDNSGPKYHRLLLPLALMPGVEIVSTHILTDELCEGVDIIFFNRMLPYQGDFNSIEKLKAKHGFKLVVDFDDHWTLDKDHILYKQYQQSQASLLMKMWLQECDAVTVTHERLAHEALQYNDNVHVLPNAVPRFGQFLTDKQPSETLRLFWAGGVTHEHDIALLKNPVRQFKDVIMVMGGYSKQQPYYRMRNDFTNYGKVPNELLEALPVSEYYHMYSKCDVALVPLKEGRFNSYKSNLKILEAANIGANVIVSNVDPYKDIPYVNYVNDPQDWAKHVSWVQSNPDEAKEQAKALQLYCSERFNFKKINETRKQIFEELCLQKTEQPLKDTEAITTLG